MQPGEMRRSDPMKILTTLIAILVLDTFNASKGGGGGREKEGEKGEGEILRKRGREEGRGGEEGGVGIGWRRE